MLEITVAAVRVALCHILLNITGMPSVWQMLLRLIWKHSGKEGEVHYMEYSYCLIPDTNNLKQNSLCSPVEKEAPPEGDLRAIKLGLLFWITLRRLIKLGKVSMSYNVCYQEYKKEQARKKQYPRWIISMTAIFHSTGCFSLYTCSPFSIVQFVSFPSHHFLV